MDACSDYRLGNRQNQFGWIRILICERNAVQVVICPVTSTVEKVCIGFDECSSYTPGNSICYFLMSVKIDPFFVSSVYFCYFIFSQILIFIHILYAFLITEHLDRHIRQCGF